MGEVLRVQAQGVADVEQMWRRFAPSARLQRVEPQRFRFDWASADVGGLSVVGYELTASVHSTVAPVDQLMVCRVLSAGAEVWTDTATLDAGQPWATSGDTVRARWNKSARVQAFIFDRALAEPAARQDSGDHTLRLRVRDPRPISPAAGRTWEGAARYVAETLMAGTADPLIEAELRRHALQVTLATFSTTYLESRERAVQRIAAPATVRRALAYIDAHAAEPITIDDIARAAGISTRGLQYAFRRALDISPGEQLRRVRLAGAHAELRDGGSARVADVARRWGFPHTSRFAAFYREAYGVNPAETLRRAQ